MEMPISRSRAEQEKRIDIARRYTEGLSGVPGITPPAVAPDTTHVFHKYVIQADDRDALKRYLSEKGIGAAVHYPVLMPHQPCMKPFHPPAARFPHAEAASRTLLSLPIYPELTTTEVDTIIDAIRTFVEGRSDQAMEADQPGRMVSDDMVRMILAKLRNQLREERYRMGVLG